MGVDAEANMGRLAQSPRSWLDGKRGLVSFGIVIFGLTWLATHIGSVATTRMAAVWPVNAVIVVVLLRHPRRRWLSFLLVAILAHTVTSFVPLANWRAQLGLGVCDALESFIAAKTLLWLIGPDLDLSKRKHLIIFGAVSLGAAIISGLPAGLVFLLSYGSSATFSLRTWAISNTVGAVIVAPALLAIRSGELRALFSRQSRLRTVSILGGEVIVIAAASWLDDPLLKGLIFVALMTPALELDMTGAAVGVLAGETTLIGLAGLTRT